MAARVRPRPRFATRKTESTPTATSESPLSAGPSTSFSSLVQDENAFFMRNTNRHAKTWKQFEKNVEMAAATQRPSDVNEDDDADDPVPFRPRNSPHKGGKAKQLPDWKKKMAELLTEGEDDDTDDFEALDDETPRARRSGDVPRNGRKRGRSRSRSITPPPALPQEQLRMARNLAYKVLENTAVRPVSPTLLDEDRDEIVELNPELARIAQAVRRQALSVSPSRDLAPASAPARPVKLTVKWIPHPEDEFGQARSWSFTLNRIDSFVEIFEATANEADVLSDDLVITFDGKRVFAVSTPQALEIWAEAEFEACTKSTYEYIRSHRHERNATATKPDSIAYNHAVVNLASDSEAETDHSQDGEAKDTFKITLRSSSTKNITVTVRPTTKCGTIVSTFLKRAGIKVRNPKKVKLVVDGDSLDPGTAIEEADLEDGDMVDIIGL